MRALNRKNRGNAPRKAEKDPLQAGKNLPKAGKTPLKEGKPLPEVEKTPSKAGKTPHKASRTWRKVGKRVLFPPGWVVALTCLLGGVGLGTVFLRGDSEHPLAYGVYALSAYAMTILCAKIAVFAPKAYRNARETVYANPLGRRYFTDREFKAQVGLWSGLAVNLAYVLLNLFSGLRYRSLWFGIFALYYALMALMRLTLARVKPDEASRRRRCRVCGGMLLTVNLLLSGMVMMMVSFGRGFEYRGMLIYVQALYTFCVTGFALRDLIRYRRRVSPILAASKAVKLTAALFSMLFLETGMFAQFGGDMTEGSKQLFLTLTGGGICLLVTGLSVWLMRTGSTRQSGKA